jgi:ribosomal protein S18 acetylase RimI-like enzyme
MDVLIRPLREEDLKEAERIFRLSFGTFMGLPDPLLAFGDSEYVQGRFKADPTLCLAAEFNGKLVGSNFIANWGSVGFFGPLTIDPGSWDKGIAKKLMEKTMEIFHKLGTKHIGLFTFANSPKHIHLYQLYGFWPRFLTAVMSKPVNPDDRKNNAELATCLLRYSENPQDKKSDFLHDCYSLTDSIYRGLDLTVEIVSVESQKLGESFLLISNKNDKVIGIVICHCGTGTEAGKDTCYVKFGAAAHNKEFGQCETFSSLLRHCERFAQSQGLSKVVAGVNIGNLSAYQNMLAAGFKTEFQGVIMTKDSDPGYHKEDIYVIDDWR